ncbi:MAG: hypothetical protein R6X18_01190 [Chloroflexota bacterium]|jgi:glutamine cyclotransferase
MTKLTTVETYEAPGRGPAGLAWDGKLLWNADYKEGKIFGLDPADLLVRRQLLCHGNLSGLTWDGSALWQSLYDEAMLRRLNPLTNDFDQHIILTEYGWLSGLTWDGQYLWVTAQQKGHLLVLDKENGSVVRSIDIPIACGDIDYKDGALWLSIAAPMVFDKAMDRFEWLGPKPSYAIVQIDPADGREIARYEADRFYTGLTWMGDNLLLAHSGERRLYRCRLA